MLDMYFNFDKLKFLFNFYHTHCDGPEKGVLHLIHKIGEHFQLVMHANI